MFEGSMNVVTWVIVAVTLVLIGAMIILVDSSWGVAVVFVAGCLLAASPRVIKEWERGVLLRLGKFRRILLQGIAWIVPGFDNAYYG